jgi:PKHD-type hydroxylase
MVADAEKYASTLPFVSWAGAFTPAELDRIEAYGDRLTPEKATVAAEIEGKEDDSTRISRTAWIARNAETEWFYDRMERLARTLNDRVWQFALSGFSELFQYTIYDGPERAHFDWHVDQGYVAVQRKLSISLQLTDGAQYEGCDLQFHGRKPIDNAPRERGVVVAFPSYVLHRVTPIVSGTRKAVVIWVTGPKFK